MTAKALMPVRTVNLVAPLGQKPTDRHTTDTAAPARGARAGAEKPSFHRQRNAMTTCVATLQPLPLGHIRLLTHCTKARAQAGRAANGDYQLCIPVHHRMGPQQVEPYLLIWRGPDAQAFWQQHGAEGLASGTPLLVQAHHLRAHAAGRAPEIHAHVFTCEIAPARNADKREQLSTQEQTV